LEPFYNNKNKDNEQQQDKTTKDDMEAFISSCDDKEHDDEDDIIGLYDTYEVDTLALYNEMGESISITECCQALFKFRESSIQCKSTYNLCKDDLITSTQKKEK